VPTVEPATTTLTLTNLPRLDFSAVALVTFIAVEAPRSKASTGRRRRGQLGSATDQERARS
jgi:hypothetical protein